MRACRALIGAAGLAIALLPVAGCSSGGPQVVIGVEDGYTSTFPTQVDEVNDIGLSHGWLYNTSSQTVHLISASFSPSPKNLHLLNVLAYSYTDTHDSGIISGAGVLPKECPHEFRPHPLSVVTIKPHSHAGWLVVLAFTISKPGVYHLNQVRIDYETQGHSGWQYQNVNTTVTVKNPPLPGPLPVPPSSVCFNPKTDP